MEVSAPLKAPMAFIVARPYVNMRVVLTLQIFTLTPGTVRRVSNNSHPGFLVSYLRAYACEGARGMPHTLL